MEDFKLVGPNGTDVNNEFLKAYRDALRNQYDANVSSYAQQKRNADAQIMSSANEGGMMYSNFPQRSKIQSESSYLQGLSKLRSTYQTGLDKLRNNAVDTYNQIKAYEEAISDLNKSSGGSGSGYSGGTGSGYGDDSGDSTSGNGDAVNGDIPNIPFGDVSGTDNKKAGGSTGAKIGGAALGNVIGNVAGGLMTPVLGPLAPLAGGILGGIAGYKAGNGGW